ncbi:MAG: glycosyltransferase family 4 protein [Phycisphaeraceae bacterium]|nr:glycosyltransferase family 4 protein [Phycisphaeraceae bacterium]
MRILTVVRNLKRGGVQRMAQNFSIAYRDLGHDSMVLGYLAGGERQSFIEQRGIGVCTAEAGLEPALEKARAFDPQIIHIHRDGLTKPVETRVLKALKRPNNRVIEKNVFSRVDFSEGGDLIDIHQHMTCWCLWRWRRCLARRQREPLGIVLPNVVDPDAFGRASDGQIADFRRELRIEPGAFVCLRIGQPSPSKWDPANISAFVQLARLDPEARLLLVGPSSLIQKQVQAVEPGIRKRITELPMTTDDQRLSTIYSAADCFLHAADIGESFGNVLVEAMMCGLPVVTCATPHRSNSQVEVVEHRRGGLVAASRSNLGDALIELWRSADLRRAISAQCRERIVERYERLKVAAIAVEVGKLALATENRDELRRGIESKLGLTTRVDADFARQKMRELVGTPSRKEMLMAYTRNTPIAERMLQAVPRLSHWLGRVS